MRNTVVACFLLVAAITSGCADFKTYMKDRSNDLADCFTVRVGRAYGLGIRGQVTNYVSVSGGASFRESKEGYFGRAKIQVSGNWSGIPVNQLMLMFGYLVFVDVRLWDNARLPQGASLFGVNISEFVDEVGIPYAERMRPSTPFLREKFFLEIGATLGIVGFDLGFNPVEFADFLLGWFNVDITGDDTKEKVVTESASKAEGSGLKE